MLVMLVMLVIKCFIKWLYLFISGSFQKTQGETIKLEERRFHVNIQKGVVTMRAMKLWNYLSKSDVLAETVASFKKQGRKYRVTKTSS